MTDTLTFTTPTRRRASQPPLSVNWCGEQITVRRPKDSVLYFSSPAMDNDVPPADRAAAVFEFLHGTLEPADHKRFLERLLDRDDPINLRSCVALIEALMDRWNNPPKGAAKAKRVLVIEPQEPLHLGEPETIRNAELDLDFVAYPPKDLVMFLVAASTAGASTMGRQAWAIGMFLDACLEPSDQMEISQRLRDRDDALDLEHISEIVGHLIGKWAPKARRAERRAAARAR